MVFLHARSNPVGVGTIILCGNQPKTFLRNLPLQLWIITTQLEQQITLSRFTWYVNQKISEYGFYRNTLILSTKYSIIIKFQVYYRFLNEIWFFFSLFHCQLLYNCMSVPFFKSEGILWFLFIYFHFSVVN